MQQALSSLHDRLAPAEETFFTWLTRVFVSATLVGSAWIDDAPPLELAAAIITIWVAARVVADFRYRTRESWSRERRVVGKAEWLPGQVRGDNQRFVVTSLERRRVGTQALYEQLYCARGDMENRIKEQQLGLFADRTSAATLRANQLRLYWALFAAALLEVLRQVGLAGTELAKAQFWTVRTLLLKVAATVRVSARRIWVSLSSVFPRQELFAHSLSRLREDASG